MQLGMSLRNHFYCVRVLLSWCSRMLYLFWMRAWVTASAFFLTMMLIFERTRGRACTFARFSAFFAGSSVCVCVYIKCTPPTKFFLCLSPTLCFDSCYRMYIARTLEENPMYILAENVACSHSRWLQTCSRLYRNWADSKASKLRTNEIKFLNS